MIQGKSFSGPDLGIYQSDIFGLEKDKRKLSVIRALRSDGGLEANIDTLNLEPLDLMKIRHPQLMEIQDDYSGNKELGSYDIPTPYEFGEVRNTVEELENLGLAETQIVEDKSAEIKLDTHDPVEYRQVMNVLSEIEGLEFDRKHHVKSRRKTATDLDYVRARISIKEEHEDGLPEEYEEDLSQFLNELEDQRLIRTNEEKAHNPPEGQNFYSEVESFYEAFILNPEETIEAYSRETECSEEEVKSELEELSFFEDVIYDSESIKVPDASTLEGHVYWDNDMEEDTLDLLGELYENNIIEADINTNSPVESYNSDLEILPSDNIEEQLPSNAAIEGYHKLDDRIKSSLEELDERGLIELSSSDYRLEVKRDYSPNKSIMPRIKGEVTATELEIEDEFIDVEGEYRTTEDTVYEANQVIRKIAENLDPLNFEKDSYEDIVV